MTEHLTNTPPEHVPLTGTKTPEVRPARELVVPDWRRFDVALGRFGDHIADGLAAAYEHRRDVDHGTGRCIAHVLGRSLGRESALAGYGRTGTGYYEELREEYLSLYHYLDASPAARELIDRLGVHIIRTNYPQAQTIQGYELHPVTLEDILVPTSVEVRGWHTTVHVPGIYGRDTIQELTELLHDLKLDEDSALRAYLALPNVNAVSGDIMDDFHNTFVGTWPTLEAALTSLCELDDREEEVKDFAADRHLFFDYITPDYEALKEEAEEAFDIVEQDGCVHVFGK